MRKIIIIILILFNLCATLIIIDCIRLKNDNSKTPIICIYNDNNEKYYGIGYLYERKTIWTYVGDGRGLGSSVGHHKYHFKILYFIQIW